MSLRTRIARWLLRRRTLIVVVEKGGDDLWRYYVHAPYLGQGLVLQSPIGGYRTEAACYAEARLFLEDGHKLRFAPPATRQAISEGRETA